MAQLLNLDPVIKLCKECVTLLIIKSLLKAQICCKPLTREYIDYNLQVRAKNTLYSVPKAIPNQEYHSPGKDSGYRLYPCRSS